MRPAGCVGEVEGACEARRPLLRGEFHRTAAEPAGGLGDLPAGLGALPDELALELGQGGEDVQLQLAGRGGGVDRLAQGVEREPSLFELGDDVDQMAQAATQAVKPPDHEGVASAQVIQAASSCGRLRIVPVPRRGRCERSRSA